MAEEEYEVAELEVAAGLGEQELESKIESFAVELHSLS